MDEIALLQQQLAAVQQQETALKLSDHNIIDLLLKLQQLGKLEVIHTRTGKQFLTPLQVQKEIIEYVALQGGRMCLTDLEKIIDVDRMHVEKQVMVLCRGNRGHKDSYYVVSNGEELLTSWYLDGIMEDTNVLLQDSGTTSIGDLARQFGFAVDYMRDVVHTRLGSILKARVRNNVLYTDSYEAEQKARVRGAFAGMTRPVFVPDVVRSFGFDEAVANETLTELMQMKVLMGTLRGREYVPYVFMAAQKESMYSFFQQNGYLEHTRAKELQVARPFDFLKRRFSDSVCLQESVVSRALQLQLEGAVEAAVNDNSLVDVRSVLPSALSAGDVALLLGTSSGLKKTGHAPKAYQIANTYAVSLGFFVTCLEKFGEDATTKATCAAAQQKSSGVKAVFHESRQEVDDDEGSDVGTKLGKKGKRGKGGNKRSQEETRGKSRKATKSKRELKRDEDAGDDDDTRSTPAQLSIVPTREEMSDLLVKWFPVVHDLKGDDELMDGIIAHIENKTTEVYSTALTKAMSSILRGDASSLRELRKTFEHRFDEQFTNLLVLEKGYNKLLMHVDATDASGMEQLAVVEVHLLETFAVELAALVTSFIAESNSLELEGVSLLSSPSGSTDDKTKVATDPVTTLSDKNRKIIETNLPQATASFLVRLWILATAGRRSLNDFMAYIPVLAETLSMPLRKLDRKKERKVIFGYRQAISAELGEVAVLAIDNNQQYALIATLVLQLFFQQLTGLPGSFPRDNVSYGEMMLNAFRDSVPKKAMQIIQAFLRLASAMSSGEKVAEEQKSTWNASLDAVRGLVLLKDPSSIQ
ncbi:hypothetical protein KXD40_008139 [Peronospora effusa]|nr:hypothetical protein KXD40_008139 [Peronospora effusa]